MESALKVFAEYAAAFEQTYVDDDWSRLAPFFADNATYDVVGGPLACSIQGRQSVLAGLKKSIDGLDRRCSERIIDITEGPLVTESAGSQEVSLDWTASYRRGDSPLVTFPGRSVMQVTDGRITALRDEYRDEEMAPIAEWMEQYGADLDGSYV